MPQFQIEQVALHPKDPKAAIRLLNEMGAGQWADDVVMATGSVHGSTPETNVADLAFEYDMLKGANELEVLHYKAGKSWMGNQNRVSHLGMHCSAEELEEWKDFFHKRGYKIAQEVKTDYHSNPVIAGKRWYHYCIFDTHEVLSVDVKFIVRRDSKDD